MDVAHEIYGSGANSPIQESCPPPLSKGSARPDSPRGPRADRTAIRRNPSRPPLWTKRRGKTQSMRVGYGRGA